MQNRVDAALDSVGRLFLMASFTTAMSITVPGSVNAQRATGAERPDDRNTSRVLGNMELTAADNVAMATKTGGPRYCWPFGPVCPDLVCEVAQTFVELL